MKEKQNRRWGLLLISFLCAFLVWLGVVNVADPVMTDTVEVPVEIINSDVLTKNNLTYAVVGKSTTTVQYEVKTTNAYRIRSSDFRAYADMTDMWSVTGAIPIKVEVLNHSEYLVSMPVSRTGTIKIETEPLQRKTFTIGVMTTGMLEDGYQTGKVTLSGFSFLINCSTTSVVSGSIYTRSAISLSVMIVAGLEFKRTTSMPSSFKERQACVPA